ncbi:MAG: hypothetical protein H7A37_01045 [Chlamydiales bacterium]|nr:hypothetical protein [Chlamydiales bacterium]
MDFTRQPIIESVITSKEGCKLVVRSSKGTGQEEYFVDAVEVVSFGHSFFFRSLEKPKAFLVPVTDYEILEVREPRMVLKNVGLDRSIKIAGGKESPKTKASPEKTASEEPAEQEPKGSEKKRERRRTIRRRRGRGSGNSGEEGNQENGSDSSTEEGEEKIALPKPSKKGQSVGREALETTTSVLTSLLPPPPTLISDTIERYKDNELFKKAFFQEEEQQQQEVAQEPIVEEEKSVEIAPVQEDPALETTPVEEESVVEPTVESHSEDSNDKVHTPQE